MATFYTVYWGKSGGTLTISGKSVSGASTAYTAAQQQAAATAIPPWRRSDSSNGTDITAIRFVNTPKCGNYGFVSNGAGSSHPWFMNLTNLKSVSGGVDASAVTANLTYGFGGCGKLESISIEGWSIPNATGITGLTVYSTTALKTVSFKNVSLPKCTQLGYTFQGHKNLTTVNLSGCKMPSMTDTKWMFSGCEKLVSVDLTNADFSGVTTASYMFSSCKSLKTVTATGCKLTSLTDASGMFYNCTSLVNLSLSGSRNTAVTDLSGMFSGCTSLKTTALGWGISNVQTMRSMFSNCKAMETRDFSGWGTLSRLTDVSLMFSGCTSLRSVTFTGLTTGRLTSVNGMFQDCSSLESVDIAHFDVSGCTTISKPFYGCSKLATLDLHGWNLASCTQLVEPFYGCNALATLDVSGWTTTALTSANRLFTGLPRLRSLDLTSWDTSKVTDMGGMFHGCTALESVDLSNADTSKVINFSQADVQDTLNYMPMFRGCDNLTTVKLGAKFTTAAARARDEPRSGLYYSVLALAPAVNLTSGKYVASDDDLAQLEASEVAGTWRIGGEQMLTAFAYRTQDGQATSGGMDITIDCTWRTSASGGTRILRVFLKEDGDSAYPSNPTRTLTLSGDAGNTVVTLAGVGGGDYDLRVEFYDGDVTYVAFPSIAADVMLFSLSPQGDAIVRGSLEIGGRLTVGTTVLSESQLIQLLGLI